MVLEFTCPTGQVGKPFFLQYPVEFTGLISLCAGVPPFVPTVSSVDDVSNFDEFEPMEPRSHNNSILMRARGGFSGYDLPFVGFTYTKTPDGNPGMGDV